MERRILVTGGAGFVGSNLVTSLLDDGHFVCVMDDFISGFLEKIDPRANMIEADLIKDRTYWWDMLKNIEVIYHLAAQPRIQVSLKKPYANMYNNLLSTLNILEWARKHPCQVIYSGSSSFYGGIYKSPYAFSKHQGEQMCRLYSEVYDLNTVVARFYNVYGPKQIETGEYATVLGIWASQFRKGQPLTVTGDGTQLRDFTHIYDLVAGLKLLLGGQYNADIFEFGKGENFSLNELAKFFDTEIEYIDGREGEYDKTLCDYTKAKTELGWEPRFNVKDYIDSLNL